MVGFRRSGAPFHRNPDLDGKKSNFTVYPFDRRPKRVRLWTILLDYVREGIGIWETKKLARVVR